MTQKADDAGRQATLAGIVGAVLRRLGYYLFWTGYYTEHLLVIELEIIRRLILLADPRVHSESRRVRSVTEGLLSKQTNKFFVLVIYTKMSVPAFTANLIAALKSSPFNLVIVSNIELDPVLKDRLLANCRLLIERSNIGRDFGAYKDAISILTRRFARLERLVIANDSVFYLNKGLDRLIADLDGAEPFIGVSEVFDHHYHVATFLTSFGEPVLKSAAFTQFWQTFRPVTTRRWNIFRGEGALTAELLQAGFHPHVLYKAEHLRPHLRPRNAKELSELVALLPTAARADLAEESPHLTGANVSKGGFADDFAQKIIDIIMSRNQMHMAGALFRKYLGLPIIKRDIVYREIYLPNEAAAIVDDIEQPIRDEIMADLKRRGTAADLGWFKRALYRHSAV